MASHRFLGALSAAIVLLGLRASTLIGAPPKSVRTAIGASKALDVTEYRGGRPEREIVVTAGSDIHVKIVRSLESLERPRISFVSYAPRVLIRGDRFTANLVAGMVVLNSVDANGKLSFQYECRLERRKEAELRRPIESALTAVPATDATTRSTPGGS